MGQSSNSFDIGETYVEHHFVGNGVTEYLLFSKNWVVPLGVVWAIRYDQTVHIFHSYVLPFARRKGIRKKINDYIETHCSRIVSGRTASSQEGIAFMKKQGYRENKELDIFFKEVKK